VPPSLQIQTVLYKPSPGSIDRFLSSVSRAADLAKTSTSVGNVSLVIGDCSPLRVLRAAHTESLEKTLRQAGIDHLRYEFFDENLGSAAGHNLLLQAGDTDLVLILNPDVVASPHLIQELTLRLDDHKIGLVEARQLPIEHPKSYDLATGETSWASTACALIPRHVIKVVGEFDAHSFFLYCDDVDYSWRIRLAGYKIIFHPPARVFHDKRLDTNGHIEVGSAEEYYAAEAALMMTHKWSRPDLLDTFLHRLAANGSSLQRQAAQTFLKRRALGDLPEPLDQAHQVGEFHGDNWAIHRW
jgi:GT2 family glycosyltransferase